MEMVLSAVYFARQTSRPKCATGDMFNTRNLRHCFQIHQCNHEDLTTVLLQIEPCLNSIPLAILPCENDGIDALTPVLSL